MADGTCGPSNALQGLQKHTAADRTLQQDRLTARQSPSQGFRSSPRANAGALDPEFEAFQAGQASLHRPETNPHGFIPQNLLHPYEAQQRGHPGSVSWVNDFQQVNTFTPATPSQPHFHQRSPQQQHNSGGWHQDFTQQNQPRYSGHSQPTYAPSMTAMSRMQTFAAPLASSQGQSSQVTDQHLDSFDDEAFSRAFDEAANLKIESEQTSKEHQYTELGQDIMINESAERWIESDHFIKQERLGADRIHDPMKADQEQLEQQDDPDALSWTAAVLLDSVKDNQTDKFQNSQFLKLMRQLRDKEVRVEGDEIVSTDSGDPMKTIEVNAP